MGSDDQPPLTVCLVSILLHFLVLCFFDIVLGFLSTNFVVLSQAISNLKEEGFDFPPREKLMEYTIMVTTLFTAGR